jgi:hypothetical protein
MVPAQGRPPQFAQLYIIDDPEQQVQSRIEALGQAGPDLDADLLQQIQDCLHNHNTYVQQFKQNMVSQFWVQPLSAVQVACCLCLFASHHVDKAVFLLLLYAGVGGLA